MQLKHNYLRVIIKSMKSLTSLVLSLKITQLETKCYHQFVPQWCIIVFPMPGYCYEGWVHILVSYLRRGVQLTRIMLVVEKGWIGNKFTFTTVILWCWTHSASLPSLSSLSSSGVPKYLSVCHAIAVIEGGGEGEFLPSFCAGTIYFIR